MATYVRRILNGNGRRTIFIVAVGLVLFTAISTAAYLTVRPRAAHADAAPVLLLVHGFMDNCGAAFETPSSSSGSDTALQYLQNHGWNGSVHCIGFYNPNFGWTTQRNDGSTFNSSEPRSGCGPADPDNKDINLYRLQSNGTDVMPCDVFAQPCDTAIPPLPA